MTEELKKAIEIVRVNAEANAKGLYHLGIKIENALSLISSALSTDKTLEVVKRRGSEMTFKEYLESCEPKKRVNVFGKNNREISSCSPYCHLQTSPRLLNKKVLYDGFDQNEEYVVVLNFKAKVY